MHMCNNACFLSVFFPRLQMMIVLELLTKGDLRQHLKSLCPQ